MDAETLTRIEQTKRAQWSSRQNRYIVVAEVQGKMFAWCCPRRLPIRFEDLEEAKAAAVTAPLEEFWSLPV